jgi:hypothetical protein
MTSPAITVITEQHIIAALRHEHEFAVAVGDKDRANTILGIGLDLARRIAETNGWDEEARKDFIHRMFK